jgi:hypothetical protein
MISRADASPQDINPPSLRYLTSRTSAIQRTVISESAVANIDTIYKAQPIAQPYSPITTRMTRDVTAHHSKRSVSLTPTRQDHSQPKGCMRTRAADSEQPATPLPWSGHSFARPMCRG